MLNHSRYLTLYPFLHRSQRRPRSLPSVVFPEFVIDVNVYIPRLNVFRESPAVHDLKKAREKFVLICTLAAAQTPAGSSAHRAVPGDGAEHKS